MTTITDSLLQEAQAQIIQGELSAAADTLDAVLKLEPLNLPAHNLREQHRLRANFGDWTGVNALISPDDDIFRFFSTHPTSKNPVRDYLADGWRTMMELNEVLDLRGTSVARCCSFLEFACGHGRFTRHLARVLTQGQLTASDVVPGSVDFLKNAMQVKGFYSDIQPSALHIEGKYQVIFVLSLFSHLPSTVWQDWFQILYQALAPGGVLIFSTHGEKCARLAGVQWGSEACCFFPASESTVLDGHTYGSTYASADYVKQVLRQALGAEVNVQAIPAHFWGSQDAIMVSA